MRCAYADLPAEQQKRLEGVVGVHDFSWSNGLLIRHWASAGKTPGQPPARHYGQQQILSRFACCPVRLANPKSITIAVVRQTPHGPTLYVGRHLSHIEGMDPAEGRRLIAELNKFTTQPQYCYSHDWTPGDMIIYDNRTMLHRGRPYNPSETRMNRRTTVGEKINEPERDGLGPASGQPAPIPDPQESWEALDSTGVQEVEDGPEWLYGGRRELWWEVDAESGS